MGISSNPILPNKIFIFYLIQFFKKINNLANYFEINNI